MNQTSYLTAGGVRVHRVAEEFDAGELDEITRQVQLRPGGVLSSGMEYPGRYSRWHLAYIDPPVEITARSRTVTARALNGRGLVLLPTIAAALARVGDVEAGDGYAEVTVAGVRPGLHRGGAQPAAHSVLRAAGDHGRLRRAGPAPGVLRGVRL